MHESQSPRDKTILITKPCQAGSSADLEKQGEMAVVKRNKRRISLNS